MKTKSNKAAIKEESERATSEREMSSYSHPMDGREGEEKRLSFREWNLYLLDPSNSGP